MSKNTTMSTSAKQWTIAGIALVVILIGAWWLMRQSKASSPAVNNGAMNTGTETGTGTGSTPTGTGSTTTTNTPQTTTNGESVAAEDQAAGSSVQVSATLTKTGWVAVRDSMRIYGAARFEAGSVTGTVPLLRATEAGKSYQVVVYVDDGDKAFDHKKDSLVVDASGKTLSDSFLAQ